MKPADILRRIAPVGTMGAHERVCADLLDECERVLGGITASFNNGVAPRTMSDSENDIQYLSPSGAMLDSEKIVAAYATLAKLRGEA